MDKADIDHFRNQVAYVLDGFCQGRITIPMALPSFMCMLTISSHTENEAYRTYVTVILQDVAEVPGKRDAAEDRLVAYIVNERDEHERIVNIMAAIETLKANGFTLSVDTATNRFFVADEGPYMLAELADQAHMRCGAAARWRQRTTIALNRGRAFASKRRQTARVRKDAKI